MFRAINERTRWFAAALVTALAGCGDAGQAPVPVPVVDSARAQAPGISTPLAAGAFVDSIGVNTHLGFDLTTGNWDRIVTQRMLQFGIRHVRDGIFPGQSQRLNALERTFFKATGSDMLALTDCPKPLGYYPGSATPPDVIRRFDRDVGAAIAQLEGPNEPDLRNVANWAALTRACMADDDRALPVPFVAPAMGYPPDAPQLGNVASLISIGAIHRYFSGHNPGTTGFWKRTPCGWWEAMKTDICDARINAGPAKPLWITETGYTTDGSLGSTEGEGQVDRTTQAKYLTRVIFIDALAGIERTYLYELHDGGTITANPENGYGLIAYDGTPKPSFYGIRNTLALLADPGPAFSPAPLSYGVSAPRTVMHALFGKRDGSYVLVIWNEVPSWNPNTGREIRVKPVTASITFASAPSSLQYQVLDDAGNLVSQRVSPSTNVKLPVDDHVGFLTLH